MGLPYSKVSKVAPDVFAVKMDLSPLKEMSDFLGNS